MTLERKYQYAFFDKDNRQHRAILSYALQLGWKSENNPKIVDLNRLGAWLCSERSPVQKPIMKMSVKECSKVISALEKMVQKKFVKKENCTHSEREWRTIDGNVTVMISASFCKDCGKQLTAEEVEV